MRSVSPNLFGLQEFYRTAIVRNHRARALSQAGSFDLQFAVLSFCVKARAILVRIERMVGGNACMGITGFKFFKQILERTLLGGGAGGNAPFSPHPRQNMAAAPPTKVFLSHFVAMLQHSLIFSFLWVATRVATTCVLAQNGQIRGLLMADGCFFLAKTG